MEGWKLLQGRERRLELFRRENGRVADSQLGSSKDKDGNTDGVVVSCESGQWAVGTVGDDRLCHLCGQEDAEGRNGTGGSGVLQSSRTRMIIGRPVYF